MGKVNYIFDLAPPSGPPQSGVIRTSCPRSTVRTGGAPANQLQDVANRFAIHILWLIPTLRGALCQEIAGLA
jgi:hypothetical protein